nr:VOC family protein [Streptomyces sp. TLI_235]
MPCSATGSAQEAPRTWSTRTAAGRRSTSSRWRSHARQRNRVHVDVWVPYDLAEARIAAAIAARARLVNDEFAPSHWVLSDPEGNEACVGAAGWTGPEPGRN